ncbi:ArsR/SmtB family transcription factor [Streptomyces sp. CA-250714]|uniref:ArsR/SmtB family transcription factor n=1 Tax=Streptomyces sp. CA-250714 TaxID=3240060 RepID=UPI003D93CD40
MTGEVAAQHVSRVRRRPLTRQLSPRCSVRPEPDCSASSRSRWRQRRSPKVTPSAVSQHLRVLYDTGLVTRARHGRGPSTAAARRRPTDRPSSGRVEARPFQQLSEPVIPGSQPPAFLSVVGSERLA